MMNDDDRDIDDLDLALALRRLAGSGGHVPPIDPRREAALMAAFDAAQARRPAPRRRIYWAMAGLATAAALLIAVGLTPVRAGRHGAPTDGDPASHTPLPSSSLRGVRLDPQPPNDFVMVPGAAALPPMESGSLVRTEVPVSMLASLGVTPPANAVARVRADLIVGQDGLTRAVRLVD